MKAFSEARNIAPPVFGSSVCLSHTYTFFWPWNLIFGLKAPRNIRKKRIVFRNFDFFPFSGPYFVKGPLDLEVILLGIDTSFCVCNVTKEYGKHI